MRILAGGTVHKILTLLAAGGAELPEIQAELRSSMPASLRASLVADVLTPLVEEEKLVLFDQDMFFISYSGRDRLIQLNEQVNQKRADEARKAVQSNLFKTSGLYDGKELAVVAVRPGALAYRSAPSIINGQRVHPNQEKSDV